MPTPKRRCLHDDTRIFGRAKALIEWCSLCGAVRHVKESAQGLVPDTDWLEPRARGL